MADARLPFEPLQRVIRDRGLPDGVDPQTVAGSIAHVAMVLETSKRNVQRWRKEGLTSLKADELAGKVRYHPMELWGDEWLYATADSRAILTAVA